jgi:hypothetical protein
MRRDLTVNCYVPMSILDAEALQNPSGTVIYGRTNYSGKRETRIEAYTGYDWHKLS